MILIIFCKAIGHLWLPRRVYVLSGLKVMWAFVRSHSLWHFDPTQHVLTLDLVFSIPSRGVCKQVRLNSCAV